MNEMSILPHKILNEEFFYRETAEMTRTGGWYVDANTMIAYWDDMVREIHEVEPGYDPNVNKGISFYIDGDREIITKTFFKCVKEGEEFDMQLRIKTAKNNVIWIRTKGKAVKKNGKIIGVRGIFQDIDLQKRKELKLQKTLTVIQSQTEKLQSFAHIVSHNLRSHSGNLELMFTLLDELKDENEKKHYIKQSRQICNSLNETIEQLNEILITRKWNEELVDVNLKDSLYRAKKLLSKSIKEQQATIIEKFDAFETIKHLHISIDSILFNLLSNALKFSHPERPPVIEISTQIEKGEKILIFADNGLGIDMKKYGHKIFGLYKTFHDHKEARGLGLFTVKYHVEQLNGQIEIDSQVNLGTRFTIIFNETC
ncbi:sensor histidine kinase [Ascidiimonas aurantiaca]|uniref:sensor histidine kinase n=1 Tax=Ascidiimonas aurantiaca TaxID=1685432 RepID=UPI0030EE5786